MKVNKKKIEDWHSKVYMPKKKEKNFKSKQWLNRRMEVIQRDNFTCQMCKDMFSYFELTVHHIKPRKRGGNDSIYNLIALCNHCHDIAEMEKLSKKNILSYKKDIKLMYENKNKGLKWQQWVYGGYSKP